MLFSNYDRIRIINLRIRTDRRQEMEEQLAKVGLAGSAKVQFFDAIKMDDPGPFKRIGSHGAYHSHLSVLKEAAEANESVLILQDDCDFLKPIEDFEIDSDVDIFYGGFTASNPQDLHNSNIIGAHFMGFSRDAAARAVTYLENLLDPLFPPDPVAAGAPDFDPAIRPPIDGALVWFRRANPDLKTQFAKLSVQRSSDSDITQKPPFKAWLSKFVPKKFVRFVSSINNN